MRNCWRLILTFSGLIPAAALAQEPRYFNDVWHSADGANWTEVPKSPWAGRHASSVFVHDGAWLVADNNMDRDVWKLQQHVGQGPMNIPQRRFV